MPQITPGTASPPIVSNSQLTANRRHGLAAPTIKPYIDYDFIPTVIHKPRQFYQTLSWNPTGGVVPIQSPYMFAGVMTYNLGGPNFPLNLTLPYTPTTGTMLTVSISTVGSSGGGFPLTISGNAVGTGGVWTDGTGAQSSFAGSDPQPGGTFHGGTAILYGIVGTSPGTGITLDGTPSYPAFVTSNTWTVNGIVRQWIDPPDFGFSGGNDLTPWLAPFQTYEGGLCYAAMSSNFATNMTNVLWPLGWETDWAYNNGAVGGITVAGGTPLVDAWKIAPSDGYVDGWWAPAPPVDPVNGYFGQAAVAAASWGPCIIQQEVIGT